MRWICLATIIIALSLSFTASAIAGGLQLSLDYPPVLVRGQDLIVTIVVRRTPVPVERLVLAHVADDRVRGFSVQRDNDRIYTARLPQQFIDGSEVRFFFQVVYEDGRIENWPRMAPADALRVKIMEDTLPPTLDLQTPQRTRIPQGQKARFLVKATDDSGGINPNTVRVTVNDQPVRNFTAMKQAVVFDYEFPQTGTYEVEVIAEDPAGNVGVVATPVQVYEPFKLGLSGSARLDTDADLMAEEFKPGFRADLRGVLDLGPLQLSAFSQLDSTDPMFTGVEGPGKNRWGVEGRFSIWGDFLRLKANYGSHSASLSDLTVKSTTIDGYGLDASLLWLTRTKVYYGKTQEEIRKTSDGGTIYREQYERNLLAVRPALVLGRYFQMGLGAALTSDKYYRPNKAAGTDDVQENEPEPRTNLVVGVDTRLGPEHFGIGLDLASSLDLIGMTNAVPWDEGGVPIVGLPEDVAAEMPQIVPSDYGIPLELYEKFPIPQISLGQFLDGKALPGVALKADADLPLPLGTRVSGEYLFADAGFSSAGASGVGGDEKISLTYSWSPFRFLGVKASYVDQREVTENLILNLAADFIKEIAAEETGDESTSDQTEGETGPLTIERKLTLDGELSLNLFGLRIKPFYTREREGGDVIESALLQTAGLWQKLGTDIQSLEADRREYGLRISGFALGPIGLGGSYSLQEEWDISYPSAASLAAGSSWQVDASLWGVRTSYGESVKPHLPTDEKQLKRDASLAFKLGLLSLSTGLSRLSVDDEDVSQKINGSASLSIPIGSSFSIGCGVNVAADQSLEDPARDINYTSNAFGYLQLTF